MEEQKNIKMSTASKSRKSLAFLQKKKDNGEKIVQMCPAELGPVFGMAAELADCDILRTPSILSLRSSARLEDELLTGSLTIQKYREYTSIIHINWYMPAATYADKSLAVRWGAEWVFDGADSMLPMGVTNDVLKFMSDNYVPTYGHIGAISGWQTNATGYKKVGRTAEDAFRIFKWGYEYQENGMGGMTIELTPMEVSEAIAKKLRVPVVSIAAGAPCDGSEMVDMDTFGMMPKPASHAKTYAQLMPFLCQAYAAWANDVRTGAYPEEKNGYHMDPEELEKFNTMMDNF
ncbi:MAG TPA: 3-methyl-2-oxobutanoate hydroxymethyltransferase [Candidatus Blautia avicola]|uniref:3-methyl-2-oxobutanoate hydroxymethyltransferase n=2 Tax=Blautia TaxID=572511 RepID=A0A9D2QXQ5_9FIRM|nr:3-methyl-2-oxobutanoate hydroxymethyltransferase [Candidatus Blautia stercorigallinarum]HJD30290.1 3-methyl-2-oxobutanoate hydroxymethyltransferase [Candidatus Blautia avicola]